MEGRIILDYGVRDNQGIMIFDLKPGTLITVQTKNSLYHMIVRNPTKDECRMLVKGGKHVPEWSEILFMGSWDDSSLKPAYIGYLLHMEMSNIQKYWLTSPVQSAKIYYLDGSIYSTNWGDS